MNKPKTIFDVIIIGAGISGLYCAFNIKKEDSSKKILILESNRQEYIGGRVGNDNFYGEEIVVGAGVGRKDTDELLIKLLDQLKIPYTEYIVKMHYSKTLTNVIDIIHYLKVLRKAYNKKHSGQTFKTFATKIMGKKLYEDFVSSSGYRDYENEDAFEVLYHYQMEDNSSGWTALGIHWNTLIEKLCKKIGIANIKTSTKVESLTKDAVDDLIRIDAVHNNKMVEYYSKQAIVATRISTIQKLFPKLKIYKEIVGQPFIYIYAKFDKKSSEIMKQIVTTYTIVSGPLQKMIPFSESVYMIAYADNKNAELLSKYKENTKENRDYFEKQVENALGIKQNLLHILSIKDFYWPIGTHYYTPLTLKDGTRENFIRKAQRPMDNVFVVGEAVSRRQGWVEGALESAHAILKSVS